MQREAPWAAARIQTQKIEKEPPAVSTVVIATIQFHIPVAELPADQPGGISADGDIELPTSGSELVAYDFLAKIQQTMPDGVYPILRDTTYIRAERTPTF